MVKGKCGTAIYGVQGALGKAYEEYGEGEVILLERLVAEAEEVSVGSGAGLDGVDLGLRDPRGGCK